MRVKGVECSGRRTSLVDPESWELGRDGCATLGEGGAGGPSFVLISVGELGGRFEEFIKIVPVESVTNELDGDLL